MILITLPKISPTKVYLQAIFYILRYLISSMAFAPKAQIWYYDGGSCQIYMILKHTQNTNGKDRSNKRKDYTRQINITSKSEIAIVMKKKRFVAII